MQDTFTPEDQPLVGLEGEKWLARLARLVAANGFFERLGQDHSAVFIENKRTLLVTFETMQQIKDTSEDNQPVGWDLADALGWSHLGLLSDGNTWFRDPKVFEFFDKLVDEGFFDEFDNIVFYGAGSCGYAAAAFSVAAPGSTVVAIQPQATLDPRVTEWDDRFPHMRRVSFNDRYGYAPDMLDAARHAFVFYDPDIDLEAMHSALFNRPNVTRFRMRYLGHDLPQELMKMEILFRILAQAGAGKLDRLALAKLYRARQKSKIYLNRLLTRVQDERSPYLVALLAHYVLERGHAPRFRRALNVAIKNAEDQNLPLPAHVVDSARR